MQKKNIVHVTFDMRIGGAERVIRQLVENTEKERYHVSLFCIDSPIGPFGTALRTQGYTIGEGFRKPGFDFRLIFRLRRFYREHRIDVAHCHQYTPYVYGVLAALGTGVKVIFTEHGRFYPDRSTTKRKLVNPLLGCCTDHITAISAATRQALIRIENFSVRDVTVLYNGIDGRPYLANKTNLQRNDLSLPEKAFCLGTVARLDPIKNQTMMLRALDAVLRDDDSVHLLIVGDGPERRHLEQEVLRLGLNAHVHFTGFRDDIADLMKLMDVFLLTSFSEGTAMTLLEAMATALPCLATAVGGNPEIVIDGQTGFLVPSDDHHALAEKIMLLRSNPQLAIRLGATGRKRFGEKFSVGTMAKAYEKLYD